MPSMKLPIALDMEPMLSAPGEGIPKGDSWEYEPKWDGFRTLVFRDGDKVELVSRGARPMTRYLAFDLLAEGDTDLRSEPLGKRRKRLETLLKNAKAPIFLTPYTRDSAMAARWFERFEGAGLDGVMAKSWTGAYVPGKRLWVKVKHQRTADCVVIGWRKSADGKSLGSLLLGLYDSKGTLQYVGHTSSFSAAERKELIAKLKPLQVDVPQSDWDSYSSGRMPGGLSRWSRGKDLEWVTVRPELVCEVAYDKLEAGERFRHATRFLRWRLDKPPKKCRFDQIASPAQFDVRGIFAGK